MTLKYHGQDGRDTQGMAVTRSGVAAANWLPSNALASFDGLMYIFTCAGA